MTAKPRMGDKVHYYDPKMTGRVGLSTGWRGRGTGPYLAIVTNERLEDSKLDIALFLPQAGGGVIFMLDIEEKPFLKDDEEAKKPYWDWADTISKARAMKGA
jgi:hypothetical protein